MNKAHARFIENATGKSGQSLPHQSMGTSQKPGNANMHSQGSGVMPKGAGAGGSASFKTVKPAVMGKSRGNAR